MPSQTPRQLFVILPKTEFGSGRVLFLVVAVSAFVFVLFFSSLQTNLEASLVPRWHWWYRTCLPMQEMHETWVRSLGWEDPLEEEMATHSSFLF